MPYTCSLRASASGGTSPYTYRWTLPSGITYETGSATSQSIVVESATGDAATIRVTVTDAATDTATASHAIEEYSTTTSSSQPGKPGG